MHLAKSKFLIYENAPRAGVSNTGFTLVEVMVAIAVVALTSTGVISVLLQMNTHAMVARLKTLASVAALNQVALVSTDAPFSPSDLQIPVDLEVGEQVSTIIVYDDPNSETTVTGTMTTTVADPGYWQNGNNLQLRHITVKITYSFRKRNYTVTMHTIRAADV